MYLNFFFFFRAGCHVHSQTVEQMKQDCKKITVWMSYVALPSHHSRFFNGKGLKAIVELHGSSNSQIMENFVTLGSQKGPIENVLDLMCHF